MTCATLAIDLKPSKMIPRFQSLTSSRHMNSGVPDSEKDMPVLSREGDGQGGLLSKVSS